MSEAVASVRVVSEVDVSTGIYQASLITIYNWEDEDFLEQLKST